MSLAVRSKPRSTSSVIWLLILILLLIVALDFIIGELKYYSLSENVLGRFWTVKWWLIGHLSGGVLALIIGPFQFWSHFRNRYLKVHRLLGKIYLVGILMASMSATYMSWTTAIAVHWTWALALQTLAFVWFFTALMAYRAIRRRRIDSHREWMIRSYVVTFAFISFRWLVDLPFVTELGSFIERAPTVGWVSWAIPLFITEIILQWNKK